MNEDWNWLKDENVIAFKTLNKDLLIEYNGIKGYFESIINNNEDFILNGTKGITGTPLVLLIINSHVVAGMKMISKQRTETDDNGDKRIVFPIDKNKIFLITPDEKEKLSMWGEKIARATYGNARYDGEESEKEKEDVKRIVNIIFKKIKEGKVTLMKNTNLEQFGDSVETIIENGIEKHKQVIFTGAPGTGKTYSVLRYVEGQVQDETQYRFVQFHPSFDYSDFVEGLRPVVLRGQTDPTFVRMDGIFKEFCRWIVEENARDKKYYFIVDEINRADLNKVFGELMFGLEESYRGQTGPAIQTQYRNLQTYRILNAKDVKEGRCEQAEIGQAVPIEEDVFKKGFFIPENLYFIGTMNDIDRSVESMDFALRRRFTWIDIKANQIMRSSLHSILSEGKNEELDNVADRIIEMNKQISQSEYGKKFGLNDAYHIGPAYFKTLNLRAFEESLTELFDNNIESTLREYVRGRKPEDIDKWIKNCRNKLFSQSAAGEEIDE